MIVLADSGYVIVLADSGYVEFQNEEKTGSTKSTLNLPCCRVVALHNSHGTIRIAKPKGDGSMTHN